MPFAALIQVQEHQLGVPSTSSQHSGRRLRGISSTRAQLSGCVHCGPKARTYERVLRYPGGKVRRIRYPSVDEGDTDSLNVASSYEEDWDPDRWSAHDTWSTSPSGQSLQSAPARQAQGLPDTVGELVRYLSSEQYKKAQQDQWGRLRAMYEILETSPWVQSRPMHLLASLEADSETALTYTLKTRVQRPSLSLELDRVLSGQKEDPNPILKREEIRDGIIGFEDENDAERFAALVQAEGATEILRVECDAHAMFRQAQAARAVVVWFPKGKEGVPPSPTMLAASLKRQRPMEEQLDD